MALHANHPRERELLLNAAQPDDNPALQARCRGLLAEGIDWSVVVRLAIQHRLVPLLNARLLPIGAPLVPPDITQTLGVWMDRSLNRHQVIEKAVAEISIGLQRQSIDAVFLHGPTLARLVYGDHRLQQAVNPTVVLRQSDLDNFQTVLRVHGYQPQPASQVQRLSSLTANGSAQNVYVRLEDESVIEPYSTNELASQSTPLDADALLDRAVDYDIAGVAVRSLAPEDLLFTLCAIGGVREWELFGELCDVAWLLRNHPEIDLFQVRERAHAQGGERLLLLGLGLAQQVLGVSIDSALIDNSQVQRLLPLFSARLLAERDSQSRQSNFSMHQFQLRDRQCDRWGYALHTLQAALRTKFAGDEHSDSHTGMTPTARNKVHWSARSDSWDKWSRKSRYQSAMISGALIEAAGVTAGDRVLDLACGVGDTSLELGPAVGADGVVMTTDLALDMVGRARARAEADKLTNLLFCTADMENLPFVEGAFDAIVCRLGIMYCPHVQRALAESKRVLRPGARVAYLVCGPRHENPILEIVNGVVSEFFEFEKRDNVIDPFRYAAAGSLAEEMALAGFMDVTEQTVTVTQRMQCGSLFWQASLERGLSLPLSDLPRDTRLELERRMVAAFEPYLEGEFYQLPSLSRITWGACPN